jgi:hypothetical protein
MADQGYVLVSDPMRSVEMALDYHEQPMGNEEMALDFDLSQ